MKFGEHLKESIAPEYGPEPYLDYGKLDVIIRDLSEKAPARYVVVRAIRYRCLMDVSWDWQSFLVYPSFTLVFLLIH
jgi:hypothetical protein